MASIRPGVLVGDIAGAVGGVVFKRGPGGMCAQTLSTPTRKRSARSSLVRDLMAKASSAWGVLTVDQKAAWDAAGAEVRVKNRVGQEHGLKGFSLYVSNILRQAGRATITWPTMPVEVMLPGPLTATVAAYADGLYLAGFSRNLSVGENVLVRTYRGVAAGQQSSRTHVQSYVEVGAGGGLGQVADRALYFGASDSSAVAASGFSIALPFSVEGWIKANVGGFVGNRVFVRYAGTGRYLFFAGGIPYYFWSVGYDTFGGPALSVGVWHYVVGVWRADDGKVHCFIDGAERGSGLVVPGTAFVSNCGFGNISAGVDQWAGSMDQLRISNVARTGAEIAANWNSGRGKSLVADASTVALYSGLGLAGSVLSDSSAGGHTMVATSLVEGSGAFTKLIYPATARPLPGPINVGVTCLPSVLSVGVARAQKVTVLWT